MRPIIGLSVLLGILFLQTQLACAGSERAGYIEQIVSLADKSDAMAQKIEDGGDDICGRSVDRFCWNDMFFLKTDLKEVKQMLFRAVILHDWRASMLLFDAARKQYATVVRTYDLLERENLDVTAQH